MSDEKTTTRAAQTEPDEAAALLSELRARIEEATAEIERLTAELVQRGRALDELETLTDALLGATDTAVILVGEDRRVRAMSRGAAELLGVERSQVGRPLSTVLPDDLAEAVGERLDAAREGGASSSGSSADAPVRVRMVAGGNALVVLRRP